jgi:molecular chaperone GrpE (heat shock protein)
MTTITDRLSSALNVAFQPIPTASLSAKPTDTDDSTASVEKSGKSGKSEDLTLEGGIASGGKVQSGGDADTLLEKLKKTIKDLEKQLQRAQKELQQAQASNASEQEKQLRIQAAQMEISSLTASLQQAYAALLQATSGSTGSVVSTTA